MTSDNPKPKRELSQYRSSHRRRSHEKAHEAERDGASLRAFGHEMVAADAPEMVANQPALTALIAHLQSAGRFGYDSEFIGEHSYFPRLCLVQVATSARVFLIDPLAGVDLTPFWELVASPAIQKIVHAGLPDLEPVFRLLGRVPQNVFDTQIVSAFAGLAYPVSLAKLIHELVGPDITRSGRDLKFSQWDRRPLTAAQLRYAADDVRFLPLLQQILNNRLQASGNESAAREECGSLSNEELYRFDAQSQRVRVRGVEALGRRRRRILQSLLAWRDRVAREQDLPPRSLLRDEILLALAKAPVESVAQLGKVWGFPRPVAKMYGQEIIDVMGSASHEPLQQENPTENRVRNAVQDRRDLRASVDALWEAVRARCGQRQIEPGIAASKRELAQILRAVEHGDAAASSRLARGWRRELLWPILESSLGWLRNQ